MSMRCAKVCRGFVKLDCASSGYVVELRFFESWECEGVAFGVRRAGFWFLSEIHTEGLFLFILEKKINY